MTGPTAHLHHSTAPTPDVADPSTLRVITWNIEFAHHTLRAIRAIETGCGDADIVLLQEMDERGTAEIAGHLDLNYAYVALSVHPQSDRNFGNAILSPWPLADAEVTQLPYVAPFQGQPRAILGVTVRHPSSEVRAYSVHTETPVLSHRRRLRQFVAIGETVARRADVPVVLGGDFNTASTRSVRAVATELEGSSLRRINAEAGPTFRRAARSFELDHLFVRGLSDTTVGLLSDHAASDHDGLWADLTLSE